MTTPPKRTDADARAEAEDLYTAIHYAQREAAIREISRALTLARISGGNAALAGYRAHVKRARGRRRKVGTK